MMWGRPDALGRDARQDGDENNRQASVSGHAGRRGMPNFSMR